MDRGGGIRFTGYPFGTVQADKGTCWVFFIFRSRYTLQDGQIENKAIPPAQRELGILLFGNPSFGGEDQVTCSEDPPPHLEEGIPKLWCP